MKKFVFIILLLVIFIPFYVNAETCDQNKVSISSISIENKSNKVEEIEEAAVSGKSINLKLSMSNVGDNIKYRITVKNDSDEDYELDNNNINISSDYVKYTLESEDNSNIIKAKSSKTVFLNVQYNSEVPKEEFESGTYNDNKTMTINLSTGDTSLLDNLKNPNTGVQTYILILLFVLMIIYTSYVLLRKKKVSKIIVLLVGISIIIPISVYALCKTDIMIESNVEIKYNSFTGTLYRYNKINLRNGSNISGYLLTSSDVNKDTLYNSEEECNANITNDDVCEKIQDSIFNYQGFSRDKETLNKQVFLRHDVVDNIIQNTFICYLDGSVEYCMQGGDNGNSFSSNEQVIRDFNYHNSYCTMSVGNDSVGCSGSYGMEMHTYMDGRISAYYIFGIGCNVGSNSTSSCWDY